MKEKKLYEIVLYPGNTVMTEGLGFTNSRDETVRFVATIFIPKRPKRKKSLTPS